MINENVGALAGDATYRPTVLRPLFALGYSIPTVPSGEQPLAGVWQLHRQNRYNKFAGHWFSGTKYTVTSNGRPGHAWFSKGPAAQCHTKEAHQGQLCLRTLCPSSFVALMASNLNHTMRQIAYALLTRHIPASNPMHEHTAIVDRISEGFFGHLNWR